MGIRTLIANDIAEIFCFQLDRTSAPQTWGNSKPAFRLTFNDGAKAVVKAEVNNARPQAQVEESIKFGGKLMKQVSSSVSAQPLTQNEKNELYNLSPYQEVPRDTFTRRYLRDMINVPHIFTFYKMPYAENLLSIDHIPSVNAAQQNLVVLQQLRGNIDMILDLGKIIVVDFFIGNHDRFRPDGTVANAGNIFIQKNILIGPLPPHIAGRPYSYTSVGIDFYEAQGVGSNLTQPPPGGWAQGDGRIFSTPQSINALAQAVVQNLNATFQHAAFGLLAANALLGIRQTSQLRTGITRGVAELKDYLVRKRAKYLGTNKALPAGIAARMALLNW